MAAGTYRASATKLGYADAAREVAVEAGRADEVVIVLELELRGDLALRGRVTDVAGNPVADRRVYLNDRTDLTSLRTVRTDADGRYAFEDLPEALNEHDLEVQVPTQGEGWATASVDGVTLPAERVDLTLRRTVPVRLHVASATGESPSQVRGEVFRDGRSIRAFMVYLEEGARDMELPEGPCRFVVEAPGHEPGVLVVELEPSPERRSIVITLRPKG